MLRPVHSLSIILSVVLLIYSSFQFPALQAGAEEKPEFIRLIGPQTMGFVHVRMQDILSMPFVQDLLKQMPDIKETMQKNFVKDLGFSLFELETVTAYLDLPEFAGGDLKEPRPPYFVFRTKQALPAGAIQSTLGENARKIQFGKHVLMMNDQRGYSLLNDRTVLLIPFDRRYQAENAQRDLLMLFTSLEKEAAQPHGLQAGVEAAQNARHQTVAGFQVPKQLGAMLQEQANLLPPTFAALKPLAQVQSGLLTIDYLKGAEDDCQMKIKGRFPDNGSAKAGQNALRFGLAAAKIGLTSLPNRNDPDMKGTFDLAQKLLDQIKLDVKGNDVVIDHQMNVGKMMPMLLAVTERTRNAADRMISSNNMRQFLIAMHNFHSDFNRMPEAITLKNGKPHHSWRVQLLPYLELDNLYKQIKFDEPWNSESNKKLFESVAMPKIFAHPGKKDGDSKKTYYKVFYSKADVMPHAGFRLGSKMTLAQLKDGTSNTIALIEAGPPVLWYQPDDIEFDPKAPLPNLESPWKDKKVQIGFFDGSIRSAWLGTDEATWKGLITANGAETVDVSKIEEQK